MSERVYLFVCRECGDTKTVPGLVNPMCLPCKKMMGIGLPDIYENQALFFHHYLQLSDVLTEEECTELLENEDHKKAYEKWRKDPLSTPLSPNREETS